MLVAAIFCVIFILDLQFGQPLLCTNWMTSLCECFLYFYMFYSS